jgi:hypothetical protein
MDTGLGLSTTVLSASTPKMVEAQQEIRRWQTDMSMTFGIKSID